MSVEASYWRVVLRDLFEDDEGGWLQDVALLDRLATDKLAVETEKITTEGRKWIEVAVDFRYGHAHHLRRLNGVQIELTAAEQATFDALTAEQAKLESEYQYADELPDAVDERLGEIETTLAAFEDRPVRYDPAEIARAGAFVSIDPDGRLAVERGYVRPEDEPTPVTNEGPAEAGATAWACPRSLTWTTQGPFLMRIERLAKCSSAHEPVGPADPRPMRARVRTGLTVTG